MKLGIQHGVKLCQNNVEPMLPGKVNKQIGNPMNQPNISFQLHQYDVPQNLQTYICHFTKNALTSGTFSVIGEKHCWTDFYSLLV